jgi:hypothetical protein
LFEVLDRLGALSFGVAVAGLDAFRNVRGDVWWNPGSA